MCNKTLAKNFVVFLLCLAFLLGAKTLINDVLSQNVTGQTNQQIKSMKDREQSLIPVLRDKELRETSPQKLFEAIREIGNLARLKPINSKENFVSAESVIALVDLLDLRKGSNETNNYEETFGTHIIGIEENYPAVAAFIHIGKLALPVLTTVLEKEETDSQKAKNTLYIIRYIFREDLSKGVEYLEKAMANSATQTGKQNLQNAVEKIRGEWVQLKV